jgi:CSLREA domain-containing protein
MEGKAAPVADGGIGRASMAQRAARGFGMLIAAALLATAVAAPAAVLADGEITVNTVSDTVANDGFCSLREAITAVNTNLPSGAALGECAAGTAAWDHVDIVAGGTISLGSSMVQATSAIDIDGNRNVTIDANGFRAFDIAAPDQTYIRNLVIREGGGAFGGAIATASHVFIEHVTITNSTANYGGAVFVGVGGLVLIRESTLSGNSANVAGGAVYAEGTGIDFLNATIAGNSAQAGGGVYSSSTVTEFLHSTVSRNTASDGGGARVIGGELRLLNALIVGNSSNNLVATGNTLQRLGSTINRSATGILDPNGLQDNGGISKTIRLVNSTSNPALNHGEAGYCAETSGYDQRGAPRVAPCDDGAVELDRTKPKITSSPKINFDQSGTAGNTTMKVSIPWSATDTGSGIDRYTIQRQVNGGSWTTLSSTIAARRPTSTFTTAGLTESVGFYDTTLTSGKSYRFRVRARDEDGNYSDWSNSVTVGARLVQQTSSAFTYSSGWGTSSSSNFSGGSTKYSVTAGKWARFTFTGRAVTFVTTYRLPAATFKVYVDGVFVESLTFEPDHTRYRRQSWARKFSSSSQHTIRIVVVSGRVDVDAFAVLK